MLVRLPNFVQVNRGRHSPASQLTPHGVFVYPPAAAITTGGELLERHRTVKRALPNPEESGSTHINLIANTEVTLLSSGALIP